MKIISGGQTGVDRAALDEAIERGMDWGGWCPKGGWAEDLPDRATTNISEYGLEHYFGAIVGFYFGARS